MYLKNIKAGKRGTVRRRLMHPLACVMALIILVFIVAILLFHENNKKILADRLWTNIVRSQNEFLARKAQLLLTFSENLAQDQKLLDALKNWDQTKLLADYTPVFKSIHQQQPSITHFYFHDVDGVNSASLHRPETGDQHVNSFTFLKAKQTGKTSWGLELGLFNTLTLRIVRPLYKNNVIIGYIELGKDIRGMLESMHQILGVDLAMTLRMKTSPQDRATRLPSSKEQLTSILGKGNGLFFSTITPFPEKLRSFFYGQPLYETGKVCNNAHDGDNTWQIFTNPVKDASGKEIADLYVFNNITDLSESFYWFSFISLVLSILIFIGIVYFYSVSVNRIDTIIEYQADELLSREKQLQEAQSLANIGSWKLDRAANKLSYSDELLRIFDLRSPKENITGRTLLSLIHPEDIKSFKNAFFTSIRRKLPHSMIHRLLLKNGTIKHVHSSWELQFSGAEKVINLNGTVQDISEIERLRNAFNNSEKRYRHIFENTSEGLWVSDLDNKTIEVNNALCNMLGYSKHELIGKTPLYLEHHQAIKTNITRDSKKITPEHNSYEINLRKKNGENIPVMVKSTTMRTVTGKENGSFAFIYDLTEQLGKKTALLQMKNKIERGYNLLNGIINNSSSIIYVMDLSGKYILINDEYKKLFNVSDDLLATEYSTHIHNKECKIIHEHDNRVLAGSSVQYFEQTIHAEDGEHVYISVKFPLVSDKGHKYAIANISTDITERKQLEINLQEINDRLTTLINASPDIICFKDKHGRWLLANKTILNLLNLSGLDYIGKTDLDLAEHSEFYRDILLQSKKSDDKVWEAGKLYRYEKLIPIEGDKERIFNVVKIPLFHNNGAKLGLVVLGHDLTKQLQTEKKLRQEIDARQQISELIENKKKELEEANIALRVMLTQQKEIEDNFRNSILNHLEKAILPYIDLLNQCPLTDQGKEYLKILSDHLHSIGTSFTQKLSDPNLKLTKREMLVADLVRQGKRSNEIANLLNLQPRSVEAYRNNIRKKLHINNKKISLHNFLNSSFGDSELVKVFPEN